ncbi:RNA polymerase sigma factor [Protaetiibacter intestinalis]|uniref:RNA polymerase sigma factor n=1 Tax=Protaetiibacter intestinalis TaxID=2419774 RepID=UPI001D04A328|nr:RNA polymerase sigma factor [Protaetiibacter intestinalis]
MTRGDRELTPLIEEVAPELLRYFLRRVRQREDAADLVGETLVVLWRRARSLPSEHEAARMWAFGVARRVLETHRRGTRRRSALAERLRESVAAEHPAPDEGVEVRAAVAALPDELRELVMLVHWDGFRLVEAAALLGLNPSTARGRYQRAREQLAAALGDVAADGDEGEGHRQQEPNSALARSR